MITTPATAAHVTPGDPATVGSSAASLRSFRAYTYWSLVGVAVLLLVLFTTSAAAPHPPDPVGTAAFAGVVAVIAAVARLAEQHIPRRPGERPLSPRAWRVWATVGVAGAVVVAPIWAAAGEVVLWALAPACIASFLVADLAPSRRRLAIPAVLLAAGLIGAGLGAVTSDEPVVAFVLGGIVVTGFWLFMTLATIWTWRVVLQLDAARRTAAELAIANERLRFAADLHDIQGHSLQVIAFKSELAGRVVERDPAAASVEMEAVRKLAVDALRDTRSVVEGYRRTSLDAEIVNARNVLGSAGIDARLHQDGRLDATSLPTGVRHLLGLVVRETVTNVLRHSTATRAELTLGADDEGRHVRLAVANDGVARELAEPAGGLRQLAERVDAVGGELTWGRHGERFEVAATVPVPAGVVRSDTRDAT